MVCYRYFYFATFIHSPCALVLDIGADYRGRWLDHVASYRDSSYMAATGDLSDKFYDHVSLTGSWWSVSPGISFNPSFVALPAEIATSLHQDAKFASSARYNSAQCSNLGTGSTANRNQSAPYSRIFILDQNFNTIMESERLEGQIWCGEDLRLFMFEGQLLVSFVTVIRGKNTWYLSGIHFGKQDNKLVVSETNINIPGMREHLEYEHAKNLGMIAANSSYFVLYTFDDNAESIIKPLMHRRPPAMDKSVHNNIHPLYIPEREALLGVTHYHGDRGAGGASFGGEYVHAFFLMENKSPFKVLQYTPDFCIQSVDNTHANSCETIQFIVSVIRDPQDTATLLVSYGINDCESALAKLKLADVLAAMMPVENHDLPLVTNLERLE